MCCVILPPPSVPHESRRYKNILHITIALNENEAIAQLQCPGAIFGTDSLARGHAKKQPFPRKPLFGTLSLPRPRSNKYLPGAEGPCPSSLFRKVHLEHAMASSAFASRPYRTGAPRRTSGAIPGMTTHCVLPPPMRPNTYWGKNVARGRAVASMPRPLRIRALTAWAGHVSGAEWRM
jgi:hypothetical protein